MQNSMAMITFFRFRLKIIFLGKFGPKIQNYLFKVKFRTQTNSIMLNSMVMLSISLFGQIWYKKSKV